ncbi:hypothetical protein [Spiroplasma endosymbiont of Asaphidion curtum]
MRFFAILFTCTYKYNSASNARSLIIADCLNTYSNIYLPNKTLCALI